MTYNNQTYTGLEIAVIGMVGRFPGAKNAEQFWENLKHGVDSISFFSDEELEQSEVPSELIKSPNFIKAKGILEDIASFDAAFFDYTPKEAACMDPQLRILHECAYEALEHAGYATETYEGGIGFYIGVESDPYWKKRFAEQSFSGALRLATLTESQYFSTQVAYKLNLKGPCFTLQTACSSSLVAIDQACRGVLTGECEIALAGGVSIRLPHKCGYFYEDGMVGSSDGQCRAFDAKANGTVFSDGVGIVVLKSLEEALADGDTIHAVIKSTAVNNDGRRKIGFTAPSVEGEAEVIQRALELAEVPSKSISYIETHGTATPIGDPIEIEALQDAFQTTNKQFCRIGSVKTNIGHLYTAAGVASLIKTVLALQSRMLPPSLHFETPNPRINFGNSPFYLNTALSEWKHDGYPLRAGISSFGVGGTNAHAILEEAPKQEASSAGRSCKIIILSAKTETALNVMTEQFVSHLKHHPDLNLADAAYTLQVGRNAYPCRRMVVGARVDEVVEALSHKLETAFSYDLQRTEKKSVVFMFAGQGAQYINMGLDLYQQEPVFREEIDLCFAILQPLIGYDMKQILYPAPTYQDTAKEKIKQTAVTQPLIFSFEYALAKLLMTWGIRPFAMIGYSFGEYVAACLSGVFSLEDALRLVAVRGKLMNQDASAGTMLSVPLPEEELKPLLNADLSLAIVNGPSCIIGGSEEAIMAFERQMKQKRIICMRVSVAHAGHSVEMEAVLQEFETHVRKTNLRKPKLPYISNITGTWITVEDATDPHYWVRHMRETVRFADGMGKLIKDQNAVFVEIGPGQDLSILVNRFVQGNPIEKIMNTVRNREEDGSDLYFLLKRIGRLWCLGVTINWEAFYAEETRHRIPLPTYPFERHWYWTELDSDAMAYDSMYSLEKKRDIAEWFYIPSWKRTVLPSSHRVYSTNPQTWLLFVDECGTGTHLGKRFKENGQQVVMVKQGAMFTKLEDDVYTLNPRQPKDYKRLIQELFALRKLPEHISHLWGITPVEPEGATLPHPQLEHLLETGFYSLLYLIQALGEYELSEALQLVVITNNMQEVAGEGILFPEKATVLGSCRTIPQEYPNIQSRSVDIVLPSGEGWQNDTLIDQLFHELFFPNDDDTVAYRGQQRWSRTLEPVRLDSTGEKPPVLREHGVYLITGGLGGIGLTLAEYLAERVSAQLILVDCLRLPPEEECEHWLTTHATNDRMSQKIRTIKALQDSGAKVLVLQADVTQEKQMQQAIVQAEKQFGAIHGVIHAAGILAGGMMQLKIKEMIKQVFAPKIQGTLVLHQVFKDRDLDFFILCSSLHSLLQGVGLVDSVAADAFLDAFALFRTSRFKGYTATINWDLWQDVGMALETKKQGLNIPLEDAILPAEGKEIFARILEYRLPHIAVSTLDLSSRVQRSHTLEILELAGSQKDKVIEKGHARPKLSVSYVAPQNESEQKIVRIFQEHFGFDQVGTQDNFFELGATSLDLIQITLKLMDAFGEKIPVTRLFTHPTISTLIEYLVRNKLKEQTLFNEKNDHIETITKRKRRLARKKRIMKEENDDKS